MEDLLEQGIIAYKAGKIGEARKIFVTLVKQNPNDEHIWEWMYAVSSEEKERVYCLKQVLRINPKNDRVNQLLTRSTDSKDISLSQPDMKQLRGKVEFIPAKCPSCGGELMLPESKNDAFCTYCGSKFLVREAASNRLAVSDVFKEQLTRMLEKSSVLIAMTQQGVNNQNYSRQLAEVQGAYDLVFSVWSTGFASEARKKFEKALEGWRLALLLFDLKIVNQNLIVENLPVEPDINHYSSFVAYGGSALVVKDYPLDGPRHQIYKIPKKHLGKKYLPLDENIGVLFRLASDHFKSGRELLLAELD